MIDISIISKLSRLKKWWQSRIPARFGRNSVQKQQNLHQLAAHPGDLPRFVKESPVAMRYLRFLGALDWGHFPERNLGAVDGNRPFVSYAAFAAACLVKLDQGFVYMPQLRHYLMEHPALVWALGFALRCSQAGRDL